nr:reverse transcriptase domain-containing protein [Tanacetum cinerariifolium]
MKKIQVKGAKYANSDKVIFIQEKRGTVFAIKSKFKCKGQSCQSVKAVWNKDYTSISSDVTKLKDMVRALLLDKKNQYSASTPSPTPAPIKAVEPNCVTCGGSGTFLGNTITNLKEDLKGITTRSGVAYQGPTIPTSSKVAKQGTEVTKDQVQTPNSQISEPVVAPVNAPMPNLKPSTPYPSRRDNERCRDQANDQIKKFYEIFKYMSFEISFMDALMLMPKFASTLKALIGNKEKLNRSVSKPIGIAKDVSVKVGVFHFSADFVVVDFEPDPRVLLILERCFLKTDRALIDVHKGELTLRIGNEAITYNLVQTSRYSANYDQMTANKIDVTDEACEEYSQEFSVSPMLPRVAVPLLLTIQLSPPLLLRSLHLGIAISYFLRKPTLFSNELKACEAKTIKSSIEEPPEVELKDLPPHLEYAFLEGDNKLPVIIAKDLGNEEKSALIK